MCAFCGILQVKSVPLGAVTRTVAPRIPFSMTAMRRAISAGSISIARRPL